DILKGHRIRKNNGILYMLKNNVFGTQEGQSPSAQKGKLPLLAPEIAISVCTKILESKFES
ncbi:MAG: hypothetical protein Q7K45_03520, partial [Nanoarchaeota archaeon]|nr:hypothetical protein [Nanoarchaeota archaeon]